MQRPARLFLFRLALALGMTVRELLKKTTAKELEEWREFERIEPFGFLIDEQRQGRLQAQISNMMRSKDCRPTIPLDFMLGHPALEDQRLARKDELTRPKQTVDVMRQMLGIIHGAHKTEGQR